MITVPQFHHWISTMINSMFVDAEADLLLTYVATRHVHYISPYIYYVCRMPYKKIPYYFYINVIISKELCLH